MKNPYSITILVIMIILVGLGARLSYLGNPWGVPFVMLGILLMFGFKNLDDSPREIGVISFFGKKKPYVVEGFTLILKFGSFRVVDVVMMDARQVTRPIKASAECWDRGIVRTEEGEVTLRPIINGKSLIEFDDAGRIEGIEKQLNAIIQTSLQKIADISLTDAMVRDNDRVAYAIRKEAEGQARGKADDNNDLDDLRGWGVEIVKLNLNLVKDAKAAAAEQKLQETLAMQKRIAARRQFLEDNGMHPLPSIESIRLALLEEDRQEAGGISEIRGGNLVNYSNTLYDGGGQKKLK